MLSLHPLSPYLPGRSCRMTQAPGEAPCFFLAAPTLSLSCCTLPVITSRPRVYGVPLLSVCALHTISIEYLQAGRLTGRLAAWPPSGGSRWLDPKYWTRHSVVPGAPWCFQKGSASQCYCVSCLDGLNWAGRRWLIGRIR